MDGVLWGPELVDFVVKSVLFVTGVIFTTELIAAGVRSATDEGGGLDD